MPERTTLLDVSIKRMWKNSKLIFFSVSIYEKNEHIFEKVFSVLHLMYVNASFYARFVNGLYQLYLYLKFEHWKYTG